MSADQYADQTPGDQYSGLPTPVPGNEIRGRVWNLFVADQLNPVKHGWVFVVGMSWEGYADPNHHILLKDAHDNVVFESWGNVDLSPIYAVNLATPMPIRDLRLCDIGSGRIVVAIA